MWQLFKEYITLDVWHTFFFWFLVVLSIAGLVEIIFRIYKANSHITFAEEYIKHINIIAEHTAKRLKIAEEQFYPPDTKDINEIYESVHFVEVNCDEAYESIGIEHYANNPIYSLYGLLYNRTWDDRDISTYCHQIYIDYEIGRKRKEKELKTNFILLFIPLTKLYRGFCLLFKALTFPIKKVFGNFDRSGKWELSFSAIAEIIILVNAIIEFVKLSAQ